LTPTSADIDSDGLADGVDQDTSVFGGLNGDVSNGVSSPLADLSNIDEINDEADFRAALDSDSDGIFNTLDLDDDNDGIGDIDEGSDVVGNSVVGNNQTSTFSGTTVETTVTISSNVGTQNNDAIRSFTLPTGEVVDNLYLY